MNRVSLVSSCFHGVMCDLHGKPSGDFGGTVGPWAAGLPWDRHGTAMEPRLSRLSRVLFLLRSHGLDGRRLRPHQRLLPQREECSSGPSLIFEFECAILMRHEMSKANSVSSLASRAD